MTAEDNNYNHTQQRTGCGDRREATAQQGPTPEGAELSLKNVLLLTAPPLIPYYIFQITPQLIIKAGYR